MTNDLGHFLIVTVCVFGGITALLFVLTAVDPQTSWTRVARPKAPRVPGETGGRPRREGGEV